MGTWSTIVVAALTSRLQLFSIVDRRALSRLSAVSRQRAGEMQEALTHDEEVMVTGDYLPNVYLRFRDDYPKVAAALDGLAEAVDESGPLDERSARLVKLGLAVGALAEGAVRSNVRKALSAGATPDEVRQVGTMAITTCGFPSAIAGIKWIDEVLSAPD
jgi:4-carboxymuconolactone decarboxylase